MSNDFQSIATAITNLNELVKSNTIKLETMATTISNKTDEIVMAIEEEINKANSADKIETLTKVIQVDKPVTTCGRFLHGYLEKLTEMDLHNLYNKHLVANSIKNVPNEVLLQIRELINTSKRQLDESESDGSSQTPPPIKKRVIESESDSSGSSFNRGKRIVRGQPMNMSKLIGPNYVRYNRYAIPTMALSLTIAIHNAMNDEKFDMNDFLWVLNKSIPSNGVSKFKRFDFSKKEEAFEQILWYLCKLLLSSVREIIEGTHPEDFDLIFPRYQQVRRLCNTFIGVPADVKQQFNAGSLITKNNERTPIKEMCLDASFIDTNCPHFIEFLDIMKGIVVPKEIVRETFYFKKFIVKVVNGQTSAFKAFMDVAKLLIHMNKA